jgi:LemA protein
METEAFGLFGQFTNMIFGIGGFGVIVGIYFIMTYNSIISAKNNVSESLSAIDTVMQNRYDLIPNLVEVVKQYASHESGIFSKVTEMRSALMTQGNAATPDRFAGENQLQSTMKSLFAVAENYPDLKASTNFLELQTQWTELEDRMQGARRAYNSSVKVLSDKKQMFPSNIIAQMMSIPEFAMYEATEEAKKTVPSAKELFNA